MAQAVPVASSQANKYIYIEHSINLGRIYLENIELFYIIHLIYKFINICLKFIKKHQSLMSPTLFVLLKSQYKL